MLLETIREITKEKRAAKKVPCHALSVEVRKRMHMTEAQIDSLVEPLIQSGLIRTGRTINGKYYELRDGSDKGA